MARYRYISDRRRSIEQDLLQKYFPQFDLFRDYAIGTLNTNKGGLYAIAVELKQFPVGPPNVKVASPMMDREGEPLGMYGGSMRMHHLGRDAHGALILCLHAPTQWSPANTLYHSLMKARIWLEAWEAYLRTGHPIEHYLRH